MTCFLHILAPGFVLTQGILGSCCSQILTTAASTFVLGRAEEWRITWVRSARVASWDESNVMIEIYVTVLFSREFIRVLIFALMGCALYVHQFDKSVETEFTTRQQIVSNWIMCNPCKSLHDAAKCNGICIVYNFAFGLDMHIWESIPLD